MRLELDNDMITNLAQQHRWAATGVSDYPPRDPLVGQSRFFKRFKTFIQTVDHTQDQFAHVFAVEAEWGRGKSRLGHELIAQINESSKGWFVRDDQGQLQDQTLFDQAKRDEYLALYIRYSQVASDYQNSDNWFAYGLYKALLPLATQEFDHSIQSAIANQAYQRLKPIGFSSQKLAEILELEKQHSEETLYEDANLVVGLVQQAYEYIKTFGIQYILIVLDELETVAEAASFGLEDDNNQRLDGQAIRLIGKAIKEEDPRRKLPWLRYVALCSPLLGQQLREIQSVARRFELVELEHNAFADVSDYVDKLKEQKKLTYDYPVGLVEAVYAMSAANFGWFNVIMANIDAVLEQYKQANKEVEDIGALFNAVLAGSGRVEEHVLDKGAVEGIQTRDQEVLKQCQTLLYGQLPLPLAEMKNASAIFALKNEHQEPVATPYKLIYLDRLDCRKALEQAKFVREHNDEWLYPAVEQVLSLDTLLDNLKTFSIREQSHDGKQAFLIPLSKIEFKYLLNLLYDHPAVEFAADALWQSIVGQSLELPYEDATHIGPSISMLMNLDIRYKSAQQNSLIFKEPSMSDGLEKALDELQQKSSQQPLLKIATRVTGLIRLLDSNWSYDQSIYPISANSPAKGLVILTEPSNGLVTLDSFKLNPKGKVLFAWVSNRQEIDALHAFSADYRRSAGRTPVLALTASVNLYEQYIRLDTEDTLRDAILLHYVNPTEVDQLERIGLDLSICKKYKIDLSLDSFIKKFKNKLKGIADNVQQSIVNWRQHLNSKGQIAWPLRIDGKLSEEERNILFKAWYQLAVEQKERSSILSASFKDLDVKEIESVLNKLQVPSIYEARGYQKHEHAGLFVNVDTPQLSVANIPIFLAKIVGLDKTENTWSLEKAEQDWYFGYAAFAKNTSKNIFDDWMWWCHKLHLIEIQDPNAHKAVWKTYPVAKLFNMIEEAQLWFEGKEEDSYAKQIEILATTYGYDQIQHHFAPLNSITLGVQTVEAKDCLSQAQSLFDQLKVSTDSLESIVSKEDVLQIQPLLKQRTEIIALVEKVKPLHLQKTALRDVNTLDIADQQLSLYERVQQATLYAEKVQNACRKIKERSIALIEIMEKDAQSHHDFSVLIFKKCLNTIGNIVDAVLDNANSSETAKKQIQASSDTFIHALRTMSFAKADKKLLELADEVGLDISTHNPKGISDISSGYIVPNYKKCLDRHESITLNLEKHRSTVHDLQSKLSGAETLQQFSSDLESLEEIEDRILILEESLIGIEDKADEYRKKYREQMQKGDFSSLEGLTEHLYEGIRQQLNSSVAGKLLVIENHCTAYKNEKINSLQQELPYLKPLLAGQINHQSFIDTNELSTLSLRDLKKACDEKVQQWILQAEHVLSPLGLDLETWKKAHHAISNNQEQIPLSPEQQQKLVDAGILKMKLSFAY